MGQTFKVKYVKDIKRYLKKYGGGTGDVYGFCVLGQNLIYIDSRIVKIPDLYIHTLWHEMVHAILYTMNEDELNENEKFVDMVANLIIQIMKSNA